MKELPTPTFAFSPVEMPRRSLCRHPPARMPTFVEPKPAPCIEKISVNGGRHQNEVCEAQRLKYQVFARMHGKSSIGSLAAVVRKGSNWLVSNCRGLAATKN